MYYDVNKTLSHNAIINIIIGPRGTGKTYALKKKAINDFVKKGKQFFCVRRFQSELDLITDNWFNDIVKNGDNMGVDISFKAGIFYFNDEIAGYAVPLSRSQYYKSTSFPNVDLIIFDEFIIDTSNAHYLRNEVKQLLDLYETVARTREGVKAFLLANSLSFVNPYTLYWGLTMPKHKNICKAVDGLVLCELVQDSEFTDFKKQTSFGKLIAGTDYERFSVQNEFILDNDTFIQKKTFGSKHLFAFTYMGKAYGLWVNYAEGLYFVSKDVDPSCTICYSVTMDDHSPNKLLLKRNDKGLFGKMLEAYKMGTLRFESQAIKKMVEAILKMTL